DRRGPAPAPPPDESNRGHLATLAEAWRNSANVLQLGVSASRKRTLFANKGVILCRPEFHSVMPGRRHHETADISLLVDMPRCIFRGLGPSGARAAGGRGAGVLAALYRNALKPCSAGFRHGSDDRRECAWRDPELHGRLARQRGIPGAAKVRRQQPLQPQGPPLPAIPQGTSRRLEG